MALVAKGRGELMVRRKREAEVTGDGKLQAREVAGALSAGYSVSGGTSQARFDLPPLCSADSLIIHQASAFSSLAILADFYSTDGPVHLSPSLLVLTLLLECLPRSFGGRLTSGVESL